MEITKYSDTTTIEIGTALIIDGEDYVKISNHGLYSTLCKCNVDTVCVKNVLTSYLVEGIIDKTIELGKTNKKTFELNHLTDKQKEEYNNRLDFINSLSNEFKNDYFMFEHHRTLANRISPLVKKTNFGNKKCWTLIRKFFQSGCDRNSLIDSRWYKNTYVRTYKSKPGRKSIYASEDSGCANSSEFAEFFDEVIEEYLSGRSNSLEGLYEKEIRDKFGKFVIDETGPHLISPKEGTYPTFKQFEHYYYKNTDKKIRAIAKTSREEFRNNCRLLIFDNLSGVMMAGDLYEIDETESDFSLVSEYNPNVCVGRAIVHFVVDVFTRRIVGVSISFNNNSYEPVQACFLSMAEDGVEKCKSLGISITPDMWPKIGLPNRLRCDRGAEYRSDAVAQLMKNLGVNLELVSAGTGSLKGQVEQAFHQFQNSKRPLFESKGLITKRHDSKHHEEATISIKEFERIVYSFIINHNEKYMETYPLTKEMTQQGVMPIPNKLWQFSIENYGPTRAITNDDNYKYQLLYPINAKYTRSGVEFKNLVYFNDKDQYLIDLMTDAGLTKHDFECKIDRRDVGRIYYLKGFEVKSIPLNPYKTGMSDYDGMSLYEYESIASAKRKMDYDMKKRNFDMDYAVEKFDKAIIATSPKKTKKVDTKNLRENRAIEKHINNSENLIFKDEVKTIKTEPTKQIEDDEIQIIESDEANADALKEFIRRH